MDISGTPPVYQCLLRGSNMTPKPGREVLDRLVAPGFDHLTLERDRYNAYDAYAVKVLLHDEDYIPPMPHFIGYLHRDTAMWVGQWIDAGWTFAVTVIEPDTTTKKREHLLQVTPLTKGEAFVEPPPRPTSGTLAAFKADGDDDIPF